MDGENETNKGGAAVAVPPAEGGSGGGSPSPQAGAGAPASVTPPSGNGAGAPPRMYSTDEMTKIVHDRLADEQKRWEPYKQYGTPSELKARQEKLDRYEQAFRGDAPQVSPEERELRELLTKQFPGIDGVQKIEARLQAMESANQASHAQAGRGVIAKLAAEKLGTGDANVLKMLENVISASIAGDRESLAAWNSGDTSVINKHFENALTSAFDPLFKSAAARYSGGKARDKAEVPPTMPKGGVQAPSSSERKMTGEERRDAAWKHMQELEGQA